jgi:hypothetical protein
VRVGALPVAAPQGQEHRAAHPEPDAPQGQEPRAGHPEPDAPLGLRPRPGLAPLRPAVPRLMRPSASGAPWQ